MRRRFENLDPDLPEVDLCAAPDVAALRAELSTQGPSACA